MKNKKQIDSLEILLHRMMSRIRQSLDLNTILSGTVAEVRAFLGTDRVKVYRFHEDESGEVVAESIAENRLPSLLGQHFPAEDIPPEIRELYLKARQRTIVDVSAEQICLSPFDSPETEESSTAENIQFRSVDPCHVEYLTAMGVKSSLVVPILHQDSLWGLLVSHHSSPRQITERELEVVQLVAEQVSIAIAQSTLLSQTRTQARQEATINRVARLLHSMSEIQLQQALEQTVTALEGVGGRIYIAPYNFEQEAQLFTCGKQPLIPENGKATVHRGEKNKQKIASSILLEEQPNWQTWLDRQGTVDQEKQIWAINLHHGASDSAIAKFKQAPSPADLTTAFLATKIKSLLIIPLQYRHQSLGYLSIFREGIDIEIFWARRLDRDDPRNLLPRESFAIWRELKQGQPQKWQSTEIELAKALGNHFAMAIHQYQLYQQVRALNASLERDIEERKQAEIKICALNAELELRVQERTAELQRINRKLIREISERQQARASLERLSHQNELILNSAGEGIYGLDSQGRTTFVNPAAARMLGYKVEELQNQSLHSILKHFKSDGTPYLPEENPIYATLKQGSVHRVSNDLFGHRDGTSFPVEYVSTPIREQGKIVGAVVIFKDITERQIVDRMKDEFVSVVSHELRTPLTSIRSAIGMLMSGRLNDRPAKIQRLLEIAFDNTNRLVRLINDILDLERIKSGKVTMDKRPCNATDLMTQAVEVMQAIAERAKITLSRIPLSVNLWADPDRIIQTITNLLSNAIKFSPQNTTVWLTAELQDEQMVLFKIKDQGRGIPQDKLETIFDRFQQVDASDSRQQGGTGLGLAICRSIVEQHEGKIWVESKLGEGSTFYFTIPVA